MSPQSGTKVTLVPPVAPAAVVEADDAATGAKSGVASEVAEKKKPTFKPVKIADGADRADKKLTWIEIELVDEEDKGVPGVSFQVTLPDGSVAGGTTDGKGFGRVEGFEEGGDCKITFPQLDKEAWEEA
jgi:hypothetical protein